MKWMMQSKVAAWFWLFLPWYDRWWRQFLSFGKLPFLIYQSYSSEIYIVFRHINSACVGKFCGCVCNVFQALFFASMPTHPWDTGDEASSNCPVVLKHTCFNISHCKLTCPVEQLTPSTEFCWWASTIYRMTNIFTHKYTCIVLPTLVGTGWD